MKNHQTWCPVIIFVIITGVGCFHVALRVPRYADLNGDVILKCEYNVQPEQLHKVEWLKGGRKLFQYVKGRTPPFRNYTTPGAVLDWAQSNETQLALKQLHFDANGLYSCEVSTETPIYTKPSDDQELTIMQSQLEDPHISFGKKSFSVGEMLIVNCTSGPAQPTPGVTWLINGREAEESMKRTFPEESPNSVTVQLSLKVIEAYLNGLELTCLSTIPPYLGHHARHSQYADHRVHSIKVNVVPHSIEPTPPSENNCGSRSPKSSASHHSSQRSIVNSLLWTTVVLLRLTLQCEYGVL